MWYHTTNTPEKSELYMHIINKTATDITRIITPTILS